MTGKPNAATTGGASETMVLAKHDSLRQNVTHHVGVVSSRGAFAGAHMMWSHERHCGVRCCLSTDYRLQETTRCKSSSIG